MTKFRVILAGAGLTVGLAACGNGPPPSQSSDAGAAGGSAHGTVVNPAPATGDVTVTAKDDNKFHEATASATVGQTVVWMNAGGSHHNITFDNESSLDDGKFDGGTSYAVKFTAAGTYKYQCTVHAGMNGEIDVK